MRTRGAGRRPPLSASAVAAFALAAGAAVVVCSWEGVAASSQGLWAVQPGTGQLVLIDPTSGSTTPVGVGLAALGWAVPTDGCSPTAIDTTGKWLYVLVRNASSAAMISSRDDVPWTIVSVELRDGTIRKSYPLPPTFPPSLPACAHALTEDGGWHVYVSAVPVTPGAGPTLVVGRFTMTWPDSNEYVAVASVAVQPLGLGSPVPVPVSVVTNFTVWVTLSGGLVGVDLASGAPSRSLPLGPGQALVGLQYSVAQDTAYGLLVVSNGTAAGGAGFAGAEGAAAPSALGVAASPSVAVATFVDTGAGVPQVALAPTGAAAAPYRPNLVTLLTDKAAIASVSAASGDLVTVGTDGQGATVTPLGCHVGPGGGGGCPLLIAYEPFVF
jgi:hypothetical protein